MRLGQRVAEIVLGHGGQPYAWQPDEPPGQFGVEQGWSVQPQFCQAGQILTGGVQHPLVVGQHPCQRSEIVEGQRVNQPGACSLSADLQQVGTLGIAIATGTFDIDGKGTMPCGEGFHTQMQRIVGGDNLAHWVTWLMEDGNVHRFRFGVQELVGAHVGLTHRCIKIVHP